MKLRSIVLIFGTALPLAAEPPQQWVSLAEGGPPTNEEPSVAGQAVAPMVPEPADTSVGPTPANVPVPLPPGDVEAIPLSLIASGETFSQPADIDISAEQLDSLVRDVREGRLKKISFADHKEINDKNFAVFAGFTQIELLDLKGTSITSVSANVFRGMKKLQELDLSFTAMDDEAMEVIGTLTALQTLRLKETRVGDSGVAKLRNLRKLEELDLSGTSIKTPAMAALEGMVLMRTLDLGETQVGGGFEALRSFKHLENLHLNDTPVNDGALLPIRWLPSLRFLNISCTKTTDKTMSRFAIEKGITILNACSSQTKD